MTGTGPAAVEAHLSALPDAQRICLQSLREVIRAGLPQATECLGNGMPGFRLPSGKMTAGYAASAGNPGLYPHSGKVIPRRLDDGAGFKTSNSGVLFTPGRPLPVARVHKILDTRLAELAAGSPRG